MRFRHRVALKHAKTCSTHDFTIRKQYEDKTKKSKKIMDFQFLDVRVQWKFHVFKRKIRGKGDIGRLSVYIQYGNCILRLLQKFELNPIIAQRVTNKKVMIFS